MASLARSEFGNLSPLTRRARNESIDSEKTIASPRSAQMAVKDKETIAGMQPRAWCLVCGGGSRKSQLYPSFGKTVASL